MPSLVSSVSYNLFAGGGFEVLQELPICNTEIGSQQKLLENGPGRLSPHRVAIVKNAISLKGNKMKYACTPSMLLVTRCLKSPRLAVLKGICVSLL